MKELTGEHAFVHENMAAYLAGGLDSTECGRFDAHINTCPECFDAFSEARDADRALQRTLGDLLPRQAEGPGGRLEERLTAAVRAATTSWWHHSARARRVAYATAAAVALAATGVFANVAMRHGGRFNNPLTEALASSADGQDSDWGRRNQALTGLFVKDRARTTAKVGDVFDDEITSRVEMAQISDKENVAKTTIEYRQLINSNAADAASLINRTFSAANLGAIGGDDGTTGRAGAGQKSSGASSGPAGHVYANFDARTNTVVVNGPPDQVAQAVDMLNRIESIPVDLLSTGTRNPDGRVVERGSSEHLIPYADMMVYPDNWPEIQRKRQEGDRADSFADVGRAVAGGKALANVDDDFTVKTLLNTRLSWEQERAAALTQKNAFAGPVSVSGGQPSTAATASVAGIDARIQELDKQIADARTKVAERYKSDPNSAALAFNSAGKWDVAFVPEADLDKKKLDDTEHLIPPVAAAAPAQSVGNFFLAYSGDQGYAYNHRHAAEDVTDLTLAANNNVQAPRINLNNLPSGDSGSGSHEGKFTVGAGVSSSGGLAKKNEEGQTKLDTTTITTPGTGYNGPTSVTSGKPLATVAGGGGTGATALATGGARRDAGDINGNTLGLGLLAGSDFGIADGTHNLQIDKTLTELRHATVNVATTQPGGAASPPSAAPAVDAIQSLKIIRNGTIEFEVRSFDDAYQHITEIATLEHGYVSSTSSEKLANGHVRGTIVVRVPPERLDVFLISLRSLGDLKAQQIGAADITKQYYDIESELRGLTTMETRLLDLIKNGKGEVKDLIEAESKLGETRVQIERLKGEISYYNNLVSLATITITAYEKDIASPTAASEQENVNVNVETEEVEAKYAAARKIFDDAKGRIVESQLKNADADHVAAHIVAEVPPAQADFVANQLKQLGLVASFNRDRRQTTTGGTGAPDVHVDQKDTRFTVELFNLANLQPRETTVLRVAVKDVEASYKSLLALVKSPPPSGADAPVSPAAGGAAPGAERPAGAAAPPATAKLAGRVLSSNLTGQVPEQMSADIRAEVRMDNADAILAALRSSGEVLTSQLNTNQDNANTTSAKRGLQVTLVNIASVSPKEADALTIAVRDVDGAYKSALALLRKNVPLPATPAVAGISLLPTTAGRVISSGENGQQPVQMTADLRAEIRADQAADVLAALKASGEVISSSAAENPDTANVTQAKLGLMVHLVNVAAISPREVQELHGVAANVADSYRALLANLQDMAARGDVRIVGSSLSDTDPRTVSARLTFEAQKSAQDAVEKAFTAAGLEFPARSVTRAADSVTALDTKVGYQISDIRAAETLDPKRTVTVGMEVDDVEKAVNKLRTALLPMNPKVRESDFTVTRDAASGRVLAHLVYDTYVSATPTVISSLENLSGIQKSYQETRNPQAPETKSFTKERVELTLTSRSTIVAPDQGIGTSARAALSSAAGALLYSVYLVLTGLLFVLPFAIIAWPVWAMLKRRKAKA